MRMKENITTSKSPVRTSVSQQDLQVPKSPIKECTTSDDETKTDNEADGDEVEHEENDLGITNALGNLRIEAPSDASDESDSDGNEEGISPDLVAKCPTRTKDKLKENAKAQASPYPPIQQSFFSYNTHTGGDVIIEGNRGYTPNIIAEEYIPQSVIELSDLSGTDIDDFIKRLSPEDINKVNEVLPECCDINVILNIPAQSPQQIGTSLEQTSSDYCNSPHDSSYGTLSPASVPSPYTLHSPNPNIPPPKYDSNLLCDAEVPQSPPMSSLIFHQDYDPLNTNETTYHFSQEKCKWILPHPHNNVPTPNITKHTSLSPPIIHQNIAPRKEEIMFKEPAPPVQSYVINRPILQRQKQTVVIQQKKNSQTDLYNIHNIQPSGEPICSIKMYPQQEVKNYVQLSPVKKNLQNIRPAGLSASEVDLHVPGGERLKKLCNPRDKEIAWTMVCLEKENDINSLNDKNQTKLMQTLQEKPSKQFYEKIFARIRRIKKDQRKELLKHRDLKGHNALYIASVLHPEKSALSRFIADSYIELNISPDEIFDVDENSIYHVIANLGDTYENVLADLLHVSYQDGTKAFNINRKNRNSLTPLHVAANNHLINSTTLAITHLLVKNGASLTLQNERGKTPLHLAVEGSCDSSYIKALLQSPHASSSVNIQDEDGNTPLHIITAKSNIMFDKQKEIIVQLITSGASHNIHNAKGELASSLASPEKKQEVKNILNRKQPILLSV